MARRLVLDHDGVTDPVARSRFVAAFERELALRPLRRVTPAAFALACRRARVVLVGEFHPLPTACHVAAELVLGHPRNIDPPVVGVEFAHGRDQRVLDAFCAGRIGETELRRRLRDRESWGYPWEGPRALLAAARSVGARVVALDAPPRGGVADLEARDRVAAARIASLAPTAQGGVIAVFGEAHLAARHLPRRIAGHGIPERSILRVFTDLPRESDSACLDGTVHRVAARTFVAYRVGTKDRARALARTWERWLSDEPERAEIDPALAVESLFAIQTAALGIDPRRVRAGEAVFVADLAPEVVLLDGYRATLNRLCAAGVEPHSALSAIGRARREGAAALTAERVLLVARPALDALARETARHAAHAVVVAAGSRAGDGIGDALSLVESTLAGMAAGLADPLATRGLAEPIQAAVEGDGQARAFELGMRVAARVIDGVITLPPFAEVRRRLRQGAPGARTLLDELALAAAATPVF